MIIVLSNMPTSSYPPAGEQRGFTLIEVLVAMLVLAIGLLGMAQLQALSVQFNHGALLRTQATHLSYQITDAMRANVAAANRGEYNIDFIDFGEKRSGATLALEDLWEWTVRLDPRLDDPPRDAPPLLPDGEFAITVEDGIATVSIRWDSSKDPDNPGTEGEAATTLFTLRTRL